MELPYYSSPDESEPLEMTIPADCAGLRVDQALAQLFPLFSRGHWQGQIEGGWVMVGGQPTRQKNRVWGGETLWLAQEPVLHDETVKPQNIPLSIVAEDEALLVINKPAGLVVHPGHGHREGTLQNGLLYYDARLAQVPRSGIVHRLDKDTSGLMVVARTPTAHADLVRQLQERTVHRHYWALVHGIPPDQGEVAVPLGRHPQQRTRMAVVAGGRPALTHFTVVRRWAGYALLECRLSTGRTHQIRVHLQHLGFPLAGDPVYGARSMADEGAREVLRCFGRQALHAFYLGLRHPMTQQPCSWSIDMAADMVKLVNWLDRERA